MSIYDTLNREQKEAVITTEGPLLLLAGAGSGKTRVLTHRIAYLIDECGVSPWNILAITFTNKAAGEMRERVDKLIGAEAAHVWVSTFHSLCVRILRRHIDLLGYDTDFTIYDTDDQKNVIKAVCKRLNIDTKTYKEKELIREISSAKNELIDVSGYELSAIGDRNRCVYASVYREYQEILRKNNALDFDDLLVKTVELFRAKQEVLNIYQERFQYIHVDEYQDTNTVQFELVHLLAGRYRNLCVVGDDDQSIYKFRGANIRNILDFEHYFPEARVIKLEQNYRSTQTILDAANAVICNNTARKEKSLWTAKGKGDKVRLCQFDSAFEEADFIAEEIQRKVRKGDSYRDFAVLYRTNAQSRLLEEKMIMRGLPYTVVGGTNFYARAEIKDILAYLKTIDNGRDEVAIRRIINIPKRGIGAATLEKLEDFAELRECSLFEAMERADEISGLGKSSAKIRSFVALIRNFRKKALTMTVAELISDVVQSVEYEAYLQDNDPDSADDRLENVDELITKAVVYAETHEEVTLTDFLAEVALVADIDKVEDEDDRVLLMTLHSAKGLEFPQVYLAGMEEGLFPSQMVLFSTDPTELEEERRLAYVGITRAKDQLTLTYARSRMTRGETRYSAISRFVREIPQELLSDESGGTKREDKFFRALKDSDPFGDLTGSFSGSGSGARGDQADGLYRYREHSEDKQPASGGKPKAFVRRKATAQADKPFITQGIGALNLVAGISKGTQGIQDYVPQFGVGDRVSHTKFGEGEVKAMERVNKDYKVTVDFDQFGTKIMYASFAKLKRV